MKPASKTRKRKQNSKTAAKAYVDAQLRILRKYGSLAKISDSKYKSIVRGVERAIEVTSA